VPFSSFGDSAQIVIRYASPAPVWNGTVLHLWAKVSTSNYAALNGVQPFMQATGVQPDGGLGPDYSIGFYAPAFAGVNPTFADGGWHEVIVPLLMTDPNSDSGGLIGIGGTNAFGVQVLTRGLLADGGAPSDPPTATTLLIDDIWLE
jgi:hypothetical protein